MNNNRYSFFFQESKKKRGTMLRRTIPTILLVLAPALLCAQVSTGTDQLREGLLQFKQERYQDAIRTFRALIFNAQNEVQQADAADAYFWISRAYLAIDNYEEAARNLEYFLANFPAHPYIPDALYFAKNTDEADDGRGTCVWVEYDQGGRMTFQHIKTGCTSCDYDGYDPLNDIAAADCPGAPEAGTHGQLDYQPAVDAEYVKYTYNWNVAGQLA